MNYTIDPERFKIFVRYMILTAQNKRCATYHELENILGLNHGQMGFYAGRLGDYCMARRLPPLNALIINATNCIPSGGFAWYQKKYKKAWGVLASNCWRRFRVTSSRSKQVQNFSKRDLDVAIFLSSK
uniref:hypothetical protein n=1 Tax=Corallococcus coralloides TaxID=184914 RepID=UPI000FFE6942|nr:hypothetical protein [Corallococcus coralloides]